MLSVGAFFGGRVWVGMAPKPCSAGCGVGPHATWPTGPDSSVVRSVVLGASKT